MGLTPEHTGAEPDAAADLFETPLDGIHLIEASAGTGKTHSIQSLYLRMVVERGWPVDTILVVTFTEAATKELRDRIRAILKAARDALEGALSPDHGDADRILRILERAQRGTAECDAAPLASRLGAALRDFDQAAIHTIHGFCARVLSDDAFETGQLFDTELVTDTAAFCGQIVDDFWRRNVWTVPGIAEAALAAFSVSPQSLLDLVHTVLRHPGCALRPESPGVTADGCARACENVRRHWGRHRVSLRAAFEAACGTKWYKAPHRRSIHTALAALDAWQGEEASDVTACWAAVRCFCPELSRGQMTKAGERDSTFSPEAEAFFELCSLAVATGDHYALSVRLRCLRELGTALAQRRADTNSRTFGDLLTDLRDALHDGVSGDVLTKRLRSQFNVALIDEFQDTDPVQYSVFRRIFADEDRPLFLVGDPKQSIYSFRSGDVFTYGEAAQLAAHRHTLGTNYRSEQALVEATNTLFAEKERRASFACPFIRYQRLGANGKAPEDCLTVAGELDPAPLKIWFARQETRLGKEVATRQAHGAVAAEIVRLLSDGSTCIGGRPVKPSDIAVLVMRHDQGEGLRAALVPLGVPVVLQSTGNVFDTSECESFRRVVSAMHSPGDVAGVRAAALTPVLGYTAAEIHSEEDAAEGVVEQCSLLLREAHERWVRRGFIVAFYDLMRSAGSRSRILSRVGGERTLANLVQLAELTHRTAEDGGLGPSGVLKWLQRQRDPGARDDSEEQELRLDSDEEAVHVITVFKSKGLEFPIVFVPYQWTRNVAPRRGSAHALYHQHIGDGHQLVVDLAPEDAGPQPGGLAPAQAAADEALAEDLRLLYVALTRAVHRTYLFWGDINRTEHTALHYLLHTSEAPEKGIVAALTGARADRKSADIDALCARGGYIERVHVGALAEHTIRAGPSVAARCGARPFHRAGRVDPGWCITSYSGLSPSAATLSAIVDDPMDDDQADAGPAPEAATGLFSFPGGVRTGNCWHRLLQELDPALASDALEEEARAALARYQLLPRDPEAAAERVTTTCEMLRAVAVMPLGSPGAPYGLSELPADDRWTEVEFTFPLGIKGVSTDTIRDVLRAHWPLADRFVPYLAGWHRYVPGGFLTGSIDLVACQRLSDSSPRYWIVDWKSNRVADTPSAFTAEAVAREMGRHAYFLQYLIYTVALDRFLRCAVPDYDYEPHMGGVQYVFLRGLQSDDAHAGVFTDCPPKRLIRALDAVLAAPLPRPEGPQ